MYKYDQIKKSTFFSVNEWYSMNIMQIRIDINTKIEIKKSIILSKPNKYMESLEKPNQISKRFIY